MGNLKKYLFQFHYKDEFGNMGSKTVKVKENCCELAITYFESTYPKIVWRSIQNLNNKN
jgi:hypothetical protein